MTTPSVSAILHDGRPRNNTDLNTAYNLFKAWVTDGNYDFTINSINAGTYNNLPGFDITGIVAGETLAAGDIVRLKASDGKIWKADSDSLLGITNVLGASSAAYGSGETVTIKKDSYTAYSGLTAGTVYYVSTSGAISTTPGLYSFKIGTAFATTSLIIDLSGQEWRMNNVWNNLTNIIPTRTVSDDPTYEISFAGTDLTEIISENMKMKFTQDGTVRYFYITKVTLDGSDTDVTLYGGTDYDVEDTASYAISALAVSCLKSPYGFPLEQEIWTLEVQDSSNRSVAGTSWAQFTDNEIQVPRGSWNLGYELFAATQNVVANANISKSLFTLSTTNNSETDVDRTTRVDIDITGLTGAGVTAISNGESITQYKPITLSSKTTYYLNGKSLQATATAYATGTATPTKLKAYFNCS